MDESVYGRTGLWPNRLESSVTDLMTKIMSLTTHVLPIATEPYIIDSEPFLNYSEIEVNTEVDAGPFRLYFFIMKYILNSIIAL
jgi:hypothetical protein